MIILSLVGGAGVSPATAANANTPVDTSVSRVVQAGVRAEDGSGQLTAGSPLVILVSSPPIVDHTLTADPGIWGPEPVTLTYQWNRTGTLTGPESPIPGATGQTHTLTTADTGRISVTVTGTKEGYAPISVTSPATGMVHGRQPLLAVSEPTIIGLDPLTRTAIMGQPLTAVPGTWEPAPVTLTYQWVRTDAASPEHWVAIAGATQAVYTPTDEDAGQRLNVLVTGNRPTYREQTLSNQRQQPLFVDPPRVHELPAPASATIIGTAKESNTLAAEVTGWDAVPVTLYYQWNRNGKPIPNATWTHHYLGPDDVGTRITATVTGIAPGYQPTTITSDPTSIITAAATTSFSDVRTGTQFASEISWLASTRVSTGFPDGTYRPLQPVNRDAMAAFMYRLNGKPDFTEPADSPFLDISTGVQFYREMTWLNDQKISTGWPDKTYRPLNSVTRDAMAAFMYRMAGSPAFTPPTAPTFTDVTADNQFYKEITWLASTGISTGYEDGSFRPTQPVKRDAMAAFMYRYSSQIH